MENEVKEIPLVSVIMPSYNHEKYIEEAIRSVWEQTYSNVELIVLDDGSKDSSAEIIKRLEKISPIPMKVVLKENEGLCRTLNVGLELTKGKYICPLASDDKFLKNKISLLVSEYEKYKDEVGAIFSKCYAIDSNGNRIGEFAPNMKNYISKNIFEDMLLWKYVFQYSTAIFSKKCLLEVGGYNENHKFEDWDLYLRISKKFLITFKDEFVAEYRVESGNNLSQQFTSTLVDDVLNIFQENSANYPKMKSFFWNRYARAKIHLKIASWSYAARDFKNTRKWLKKVIFLNPFEYKAYDLFFRTLLGKIIIQKIKALQLKSQIENYSTKFLERTK
ncbi:MAG TPA: glycosyltransferase family A protein [Sulfurovum sp.]|nr:MAG: hypothetical protein B7Y23_08610 [Sulfurovum sp. 16-42-52]HQS71915.1 glycosyltransferase family A protein [Sulfurovum sp.]HQT28249.1 glycosyltransferase family A protein [Sulfurovum sp.]